MTDSENDALEPYWLKKMRQAAKPQTSWMQAEDSRQRVPHT